MLDTADALPAAPLLVVGDALLDRDLAGARDRFAPGLRIPVVAGCAERLRPGGAALAAYLAARDGREVTLVTGLGTDPVSERLSALLEPWMTLVPLPLRGDLGERTRILDRGRPVVRLDSGTGRATGCTASARAALQSAGAVLVADRGRGAADAVRGILAERARDLPVVWDPDLHGRAPVPDTQLAVPSDDEARHFAAALPGTTYCAVLRSVGQRARALVHGWGVRSAAVTLGPRGALLSHGDGPLLLPASRRHGGDRCGAGEQFAATAAGLLADGAAVEEAVRGAVSAATDFVVDGAASALMDFFPVPAAPSSLSPAPSAAPSDVEEWVERISTHGSSVLPPDPNPALSPLAPTVGDPTPSTAPTTGSGSAVRSDAVEVEPVPDPADPSYG